MIAGAVFLVLADIISRLHLRKGAADRVVTALVAPVFALMF